VSNNNLIKKVGLEEQILLIWSIWTIFKYHNSEVPAAIGLVFMFGQDGMPLGVVTKFQEYPIKTI